MRLALAWMIVAAYPVMVLTGLWPSPWLFAPAIALTYAGEIAIQQAVPRIGQTLARCHLKAGLRSRIRELAAFLLLIQAGQAESPWFAPLAAGLLVVHWLWAAQTDRALALLKRHREMAPVETLNIDLPPLGPIADPPAILTHERGKLRRRLEMLLVGSITVAVLLGSTWLAAVAVAAVLLLETAGIVALSLHLRRIAGIDGRDLVPMVDEAVSRYNPQVIVYFSGSTTSAYQVNMWLSTLERVDARVVAVLRERRVFQRLAPTSLPVVCSPGSVDTMSFSWMNTAKVALFPANAGKNIHMLRVAGVTSVFIGHGDSDKEASFNPYSKVYDEIWVAGQAGRDRYLRAQVGVQDSQIVEVGRPQLDTISSLRTRRPYSTVLYAPTWEGWSEDLQHTSIIGMGPKLVRALLRENVRVIYKPHPLTGERDSAARLAHARIVRMIERADTSGRPYEHLVVDGPEPHLYDCFNEADLLVSDISSVIADFIASGKPYAVTNVADRPAGEFRDRYPTTQAAYLIGPALGGLPEALAAAQDEHDAMAAERLRVKTYLLGPDEPDAFTRFNDAINRLVGDDATVGREMPVGVGG
ncbi:CDP-glycerol glycerophosphotransferase family protein [Nonomuraea sp. NPDC050556]|uniref:CDP-glycerol glycerophosphotransferase family protein n=1 Tax=Nonomuraea sp. NPDC050556 TaxID=3364369 RepID=UPI00379A0BAF